MSKDKKTPEEISDSDLDQVSGGLLAHELTHAVQSGESAYIGETEKNLSTSLQPATTPKFSNVTLKRG